MRWISTGNQFWMYNSIKINRFRLAILYIYIYRQEVLSNSFFLLTFHLTRKDTIASLSSRTNCDYFLFRANLNFIYGRMPETRSCASPRSGNKLVPCNYIISANLFWSFAMWQKTGTLSLALRNTLKKKDGSNSHFHYRSR